MSASLARALGLTLLGVVSGCTAANILDGRIGGLEEIVGQARDRGARQCAPRELAMAEAHLAFAHGELAQGDLSRVEDHLVLAEPNAVAAKRLSLYGSCVGQKPGDRDGDGIPDKGDVCIDDPEDLDDVDDRDGCPEDQDTDGDGLGDAVDYCPAEPEDGDGYLDTDGCPEVDNDVDGVADAADKCPLDAEDPEGFADDDGCPDPDNDADGLLDVSDSCPNEAGPEAEHGCPKAYQNVIVTADKVVIRQQVFFETNKSKIRAVSYGLLNTVAQALADFPALRVEVQGHTDDRGQDTANMRLSHARAQSVREYLVTRGVEPYRMTAQGYGETRPIESNRTPSGRAANRRVEFVRTDDAASRRDAAPHGEKH